MAGGVPAGRLSIEIVAEVARLAQDLQKVRSLVNSASGDIAKSARAANDNLSSIGKGAGGGIQQFSREIQALKAQLDPAWAVQKRYNEQVKLGMDAMRSGAIDRQQFIAHMRQVNAELKGMPPVQDKVTRGTGNMRQGMQQLSFQANDVVAQMANGTSGMVIFAQQSGQVVGALQSMGGGAGGFAKFMGGPWGIALQLGVTALSALWMMLGKTEDATKKTAKAHETLSDKLSRSKHSFEEVMEATREYNGEQRLANQITLDAAKATAVITAANYAAALSTRRLLEAKLEDAKVSADIAGQLGGPEAAVAAMRRQNDLEIRIAANFKATQELRTAMQNANNAVGEEMAKIATDPRYAIEERYRAARNEARKLNLDTDSYASKLIDLRRQEEADLKRIADAERDRTKSAKERAEWEKVSGMEVARMLGTVPNGGGDGTRSSGRNKAAGGAKNSYHLIGQAIDIPLTINGRAITKEWIRAQLEPLGIVIKELLGPGDKGHSDHFHIAFDKVRQGSDEIARALEATRKKSEDELAKLIEAADKAALELSYTLAQIGVDFGKVMGAKQDADWAKMLGEINGPRDEEIDKLNKFYDGLQRIRDLTAEVSLGDVFGDFGSGLEKMLETMNNMTEAQAEYVVQLKAAESIKDVGERTAAISKVTAANKKAEAHNTIQLIGATKRLFSEQSTGYKIMEAAEKGAMAVALVRTAINVAQGASKIFASLGPFGFPVVGAMIAVMAGLGFRGGSGSMPTPPTAEELQEAAGAGSVLGDRSAKSNSIANSLEIVAANSNRDLEYSNDMLRALRAIDDNISKMAGQVARQISVSGSMFDTSGAKLGSSGSGGFLGMFSSSTTRELWDLGLDLTGSTVGDIITKGISGQTYQIVQQIKKKSGFFGIGGSTKTTYETTNGAIDPGITSAISDVLASLKQGLLSASGVIGLEGAAAIIDSFQVSLGKISFKGMTGEEIEQQLNAIFSKVGDDLAAQVLPALTEMQLIGEGMFETLMRVARQYQVVDVSLTSIGMTFGAVGVASVAARDNLVQLFGSLDDFVSATDYYRENFLTEAEQIAPIYKAVTDEMNRLGLVSVDTVDQFKGIVNGLDLTTQAGRDLFAAMMAVAPAFNAVEKYQDKMAKAWLDRASTLSDYRDSLLNSNSASSYAAMAAQYRQTAEAAGMGDATALDGLKSASEKFLEAAKSNATSELDYARARAEVLNNLDSGIEAANSQAALAQRTTVAVESMATEIASLRDENTQLTAQVASSMSALNRKIDSVIDGDALKVTSGDDQTFTVAVAA